MSNLKCLYEFVTIFHTFFCRYANRFQAMLAIRTLNNEHLFQGSDAKLTVKFAEEHGKQKSAIYAQLLKKAKNHKPYHRYTKRFYHRKF